MNVNFVLYCSILSFEIIKENMYVLSSHISKAGIILCAGEGSVLAYTYCAIHVLKGMMHILYIAVTFMLQPHIKNA